MGNDQPQESYYNYDEIDSRFIEDNNYDIDRLHDMCTERQYSCQEGDDSCDQEWLKCM